MDRNNNSSKGDRLPNWKRYFPRLSEVQYALYNAVFTNNQVRKKFDECRIQNLNAMWAIELLYVPGNSKERFINILERNLRPIYESARLQGYTVWKF